MYTNILVPISFDEDRDARGALDIAQTLAGDGAQITLLHVVELIPAYVVAQVPPEIMVNNHQRAEVDLAALAADVPNATAQVITGHSGRSILDWAAQHKPDCIVIASHRPGMQDLLLGSTASKVVRHAGCAVHVIR